MLLKIPLNFEGDNTGLKFPLRFYCAIQPLTSHSPSDKISYFYGPPSNEPFLGLTIGQMVDSAAEKHADREAYVFCESGARATFAELKRKVA